MKVYDLSCPKCSGSLNISVEQGVVQCGYCGSTLYIDAHDHIQLNSKKITENLETLFSHVIENGDANHRTIIHGELGDLTSSVHFKEKPIQFKMQKNCLHNTDPEVICSIIFSVLSCIFFYHIWDMAIVPLFVGILVGTLLGNIVVGVSRRVVIFNKNQPFRKWESDRKQYIEEADQQFERSKLVALVLEDVVSFYNTLIEESHKYNVKSTKIQFSLYPQGCSYNGSVNCPFRERMNNIISDHWETVYNTSIPFDQNNFVFLNIEQRDIMYSILVNRLFEETKGKRTRFETDKDSYTIEVQYDNNTYREPSLNKVW